MAIRTELSLRLPNSPGALNGVCRVLAEERVRIHALMLDGAGMLRLVVDNDVRALAILRERRHTVTAREVIAVSVSTAPGSLAAVLAMVSDAGVNIEYAYAGTPDAGDTTLAVLGVDDAMRASAGAGI
jgi:hypothetical protein